MSDNQPTSSEPGTGEASADSVLGAASYPDVAPAPPSASDAAPPPALDAPDGVAADPAPDPEAPPPAPEEPPAPPPHPFLLSEEFAAAKKWIRDELELMQLGKSREQRETVLNP